MSGISISPCNKRKNAGRFGTFQPGQPDQRDLTFSMAADVDLQQFRQIGAKVTQFNYQLAGADILNGGIQGEVMRRWSISRRRRRLPSAS